ncbi:MAG TPA: hypothetical protein DCL61_18015 [Cyanobacteria bacterium UBA12227]|nr:hypothetical protein [Cyanobacteria bacterium UBA12227]HAX89313.1 hypothetical protein [Cyanobacteria bacterium UBA11370]
MRLQNFTSQSVQSQIQLQAFFNQSADLFCIIEPDGTFGQVNSAWQTLLNWTPEALRSRPWIEWVHPLDVDASLEVLGNRDISSNFRYFNNRYRHQDGTYRWLSWSWCYGEDGWGYAVGRDITAQKQTEAILRQTQERYELVAEASNDGLWDWNLNTDRIYYSPRWKKTLGFEDDQISDRATEWFYRIHPDDRGRATVAFQDYIQGLTPTFELEHRLLHNDGTYRWILSRGACLSTADGQPWRMIGSNQDITECKQANSTLRLTQERLQYLLSHSPAVLYSCKVLGNYSMTFMSENAAAIIGYHASEFLADDGLWTSRIHPNDAPRIFANLPKLFESGHHVHEYRFQHKNGQYRWMHDELKLIRDEAGEPLEIVGFGIDITEQKLSEIILQQQTKALQDTHQRLRFHVENSPLAVVEWDREFRVQSWSKQAEKIFGWKAHEVMGKQSTDWRFIEDEDIELVKCNMSRLLDGSASSIVYQNRNVTKNGSVVYCQWYESILLDEFGNLVSILSLVQDITEQKETEAALVNNAELLRVLNEELVQSNRDLEQFAYVASHDLQEPLRTINSYTQLLARKYQGSLDAKADKYIKYIVEGTTRMQQLINDLLEFSRVGRNGKPLQPTACDGVISQVLDHLKIAIAQNNAVVTYESLPTVMGDRTQLIQLFQNLIGNGIKFRGEKPPQVHISATHQGNEWVFTVRDNGIGIESEYFDRIFTIFQRLCSRYEYSGNGIGLAICKKIVERHGGHIWVDSELGVGTSFHFTIPCV